MKRLKVLIPVLSLLAWVPAFPAALVISGNLAGTSARLDTPFVFHDLEGWDPVPGPYAYQFLDTAGAVLRTVPFGTDTLYACGDGPCREITTHFSHFLPLSAELQTYMATVRVLHGDRVLAELLATGHRTAPAREARAVTPIPAGREPRAVAKDAGKVLLTWDAAVHPRVIVKNATGAVIGFLEGGSTELIVDGPTLDLIMSDGLRSLDHRVTVTQD